MKRLLLAILLLFPLSATAQFNGCPAGFCSPQSTAIATTYQGPGDVVSSAYTWGSCARVYNAAAASTATKLCDLVANAAPTVVICTLRGTLAGFVDLTLCFDGVTVPAAICAAQAGGICNVSQVYDQSGSGRPFTQATAGNQPKLTFNALGGLPGLTFTSAAASQINTAAVTLAQPFSYSGVMKRTSGTTQTALIGAQGADGASCGPYSAASQFWVGSVTAITGVWTENAFHAVQCRMNNDGGVVVDIDATTATGSTGSTGFVATPARMGRTSGSGSLDGIIMEAGIWPVAFNATQYGNMNTNQHGVANGYNF